MARVAGSIAAVVAALVAGGCGSAAATQEGGSAAKGRDLFVESCGSCHVLADAGTQGTIGPDLDQAFEAARAHGFEESTIRDIVRGQIAYPTAEPVTGEPGMPPNLVEGQDAADVAAYVAAVAARPVEGGGGDGGEAAPPSDPKALFAQQCGACHVLADAGTTGAVGPDLDQTRPALEAAVEQITNGGGGMPPFGGQLTDEQIRALAEYIVRVTGGR